MGVFEANGCNGIDAYTRESNHEVLLRPEAMQTLPPDGPFAARPDEDSIAMELEFGRRSLDNDCDSPLLILSPVNASSPAQSLNPSPSPCPGTPLPAQSQDALV